MLTVQQLTRTFGDRTAVDDLSFSVSAGEILGLVGPNGAGKTTTMRAIAGILVPTSGWIHVAGVEVQMEPVRAKAKLAFVPDDPNLFGALTVWEHLDFTARIYGVRDWVAPAEALLEELELLDRRDSLADQLSRGMRQKVAIACALLHEPALLMLDEPLTGLDPRGIRTLYSTLRQRAAAGTAVIVSSHLLGQIESLCTTFLILREGRRLYYGSKAEIRAQLRVDREDATLEEIFFEATEGEAPRERRGAATEMDEPSGPARGSAENPDTPGTDDPASAAEGDPGRAILGPRGRREEPR